MSNVKVKISLSFVMLLVLILSLGSVFAAETKYVPVYMTVKHQDGTELKGGKAYTNIKPGDKINITAYCNNEDSLYWSQNLAFMDKYGYKKNEKGMALINYYYADANLKNETEMKSTADPTSAVLTIPDFEPGTRHVLCIEAIAAVDNWENHEAQTGWVNIYFTVPSTPAQETKITVSATKVNDTTAKMTATVTGSTFSKFLYHWDNEADKTSTTNPQTVAIPTTAGEHTLTVKAVAADGKTASTTLKVTVAAPTTPEATKVTVTPTKVNDTTAKMTATVTGSTFEKFLYHWDNEADKTSTSNPQTVAIPTTPGEHTLTVKAVAKDGTSATKTLKVTVAAPAPIDDELVVEPWMKEDDSMEELAVSLRNDSDKYEKGNKNFYGLNEEIVYYVDYKNGGDDITREVKLVLELPLEFEVIDAFGGTVNAEEKTITWTFPEGLEEDQAGTKIVKVAYKALSKNSKKYEIIYPVADILERNKTIDSSAVINYIYKDVDTEITDEHYPYMFGDAGKDTFRPDSTITRAEGALVLTRIFGIDTSGTKIESVFPDLNQTYEEAQKAIVAATKLGLINGYTDGTYRPNNKMTKAEFMKIIASYIEANAEEEDIRGLEVKEDTNIKIYKNPKAMYVTGSTTVNTHWASNWVTLLARLNMTPVSSSNKNLELDEQITRAEVAQLVNFYLLRAPADVSSSTKTQFSDVSKKHDLFEDIVEATRPEHTYTITLEGYELDVENDD